MGFFTTYPASDGVFVLMTSCHVSNRMKKSVSLHPETYDAKTDMFVTLTAIAAALLAVLILAALVAGVAALFGASFVKVFRKGLWGLLLPPLMFLYGMFIGRNAYQVKEVTVTDPRLPESFEGYRMVQISDLHLASFRHRERSLEKAVEKIAALSPDMIVFTGDLVTSGPEEIAGFEPVLSSLKAPDGVYSVLGNHDYCVYRHWDSDSLRLEAVEKVVGMERSAGWSVLMNENVRVVRPSVSEAGGSDTLSVIGVENISGHSFFRSYGDLDRAMEGAAGFKVLLSHDPTHWRTAAAQYPDIALTLSGHTHAMQLSVFGWSLSSLMYKEYRGLYEKWGKDGANRLYVNIGLGETAIPARFGARPEITLVKFSGGNRTE